MSTIYLVVSMENGPFVLRFQAWHQELLCFIYQENMRLLYKQKREDFLQLWTSNPP